MRRLPRVLTRCVTDTNPSRLLQNPPRKKWANSEVSSRSDGSEPDSLYLPAADATSAERTAGSMDAEKGVENAENIRYGQNLSESGMGGKTTDVQGEAHQGR